MRRRPWLVVSALGLAGVLLLGVFPARAYLQQRHQRQAIRSDLAALSRLNDDLEKRKAVLQSDAEIERLARQHYSMIRPGEEAYAILPGLPPPPPKPPEKVRPPKQSWWQGLWSGLANLL